MKKQFRTVDEYIGSFPKDVRLKLNKLRQTIQKAAPEASERINYQIPAFALHGNLVWFAAYKSVPYTTASAIMAFKKEFSKYKQVRFPIDAPLPLSLITKVVKFRVKENKKKKERIT
jgi:uncharacterized protein YdhG (YjbR/CyaY superfamily)